MGPPAPPLSGYIRHPNLAGAGSCHWVCERNKIWRNSSEEEGLGGGQDACATITMQHVGARPRDCRRLRTPVREILDQANVRAAATLFG